MKGNKIISLLCASALSVSSFAGLSMSVAADTSDNAVLYEQKAEVKAVEQTVTAEFDNATKKLTLTTAKDVTAWVVLASYGADGTLSRIKYINSHELKKAEPTTLTVAEITNGDKVMVWAADKDGNMTTTPLSVSYTYADGTVTPTPDTTVAPSVSPSATPDTDTKPSATPDTDTKPSATPDDGNDTKPSATPDTDTKPSATPDDGNDTKPSATPDDGNDTKPTQTPDNGNDTKPTQTPDNGKTDPTPTPTVKPTPTATPVSYNVNVAENITGGTVEVDKTTAKEGEEVTVTAKAEDGYVFGKFVVTGGETTINVTADGKFTMPKADVTVSAEFTAVYAITVASDITGGTVTVDKTTAKAGEEVTVTATATAMGYTVDAITVKDADGNDVPVEEGKFTMPAKGVTVSTTFKVKDNTVLASASTYISRNSSDVTEATTQAATNYSSDTKVFAGTNGNFNGMGFYKFVAPSIPEDKQIASAKLTLKTLSMNNKNGTSSVDVNYPNAIENIDFSTITWTTMFTDTTVNTPTANPWENLQTAAPFTSITKIATVDLAKAETNVVHSDIDVTAYVKAQVKADKDIVLVMANCSRGVNLDKTAMIEYTLEDRKYDVTVASSEDGSATVDLAEVAPNGTVTVTPKANAGKKVTGVTYSYTDGDETKTESATPGENGTYTFTMPNANVTVTVNYARADIAQLDISGASTASTGTEETYLLDAKAADGTPLQTTADEIIWSLKDATDATTIENGILKISAEETTDADKTIIVVAAVKDTDIKAEFAVTISAKATYAIGKQDVANGSIEVSGTKAIEGADITVTPTADKAYKLKSIYTYMGGEKPAVSVAELADGVTNSTYEIAKNGKLKDKDVTLVAVTAYDLTASDEVYRVGASISAPEGTTITDYCESATELSDVTEWTKTDTSNNAKISFYLETKGTNGSEEKYAYVKLSDGRVYAYKIMAFVNADDQPSYPTLDDSQLLNKTEITAADGAYTFKMPAYPISVGAEFEKMDLEITYQYGDYVSESDAPAHEAKVGDEVKLWKYMFDITDGYEITSVTYKGTAEGSTVSGTAMKATDENNGIYWTFEMPDEPITVTFTAEEKALDDRLPITEDYDTESRVTVYSNENQTERDGNRLVTKLTATADNTETWFKQADFSDALKEKDAKTIYIEYDFKISNNDVLIVRPSGGNPTNNQGPTHFWFASEGKLCYIWQTGRDQGWGEKNQSTNTKTTDLTTDTWYRAVVKGERNTSGYISSYRFDVYSFTDDVLNESAVLSITGLGGRNTDKEVNAVNFGSKNGSPVIDCAYIYELTKYDTVITVTDGENSLEGVIVSLDNGETATTDSNGKATFNVLPGKYTVTKVEKTGFDAPRKLPSVDVTKGGENSANIEMTAQGDIVYDLTVNTAPYATVKLNAGTSNAGTTVEETIVTANENGVANFAAPAGTYNVDVTSANKYYETLAQSSIIVTAETLSFDKPFSYKAEYANMIYGNDFSGPVKDAELPKEITKTAVKGNWTDAKISVASQWTNLNLKDGNFLYGTCGGSSSEVNVSIDTTEQIGSAKFDFGYGSVNKRNNKKVDIKYGDTVIASITNNDNSTNATLTVGTKKVKIAGGQWLSVELSIDGTTAKVTIKGLNYDENSSTAGSEVITLVDNESITIVEGVQKLSFTGSSENNAYNWGSFGIDNIEIYKAAEVTE